MAEQKKLTDFEQLRQVEVKVEEKVIKDKQGKVRFKPKYVSWTSAWHAAKLFDPEAIFVVHTPEPNSSPLFVDHTGGYVHISTTLRGVEHSVWMPVLNAGFKSIPSEAITSFDVNTAIMRGLAKCLALHGIGLHVYEGEDLPTTDTPSNGVKPAKTKPAKPTRPSTCTEQQKLNMKKLFLELGMTTLTQKNEWITDTIGEEPMSEENAGIVIESLQDELARRLMDDPVA